MRRQPEQDAHHILHHRQEWTLRREAESLRESPPLVPRMNREAHNELHRDVPPVPLLGHYALLRTVRSYEPAYGDTMTSVDNLMFAIEEATRSPKAHQIEKDIAWLAINAIDLQRPYLRDDVADRPQYLF